MDNNIKGCRHLRVYFTLGSGNGSGLCPTFLEGVGVKHRMRSRRLTPSRKVGAPNLKYTRHMINDLSFRLGATSYVYPGDLVHNVERLVGQVDDVELILFDLPDGTSNLPDAATVRRLAELAAAHDLTYTVHLPLDLRHDSAARHPSLHMAARVIDLTALLRPCAYVFHLDGQNVHAPGWLDQASRAVADLCALVDDPQQLALENLENYAPEHLLPLYAAFPIRRTLDIGHLWKMGRDPLPLLADWLPAASVVHLHGLTAVDHQSLAVMSPAQLDPIVRALLDWHGVLTLEVFEDDFFTSHAALLAAIERVQT